MGFLDNTGVARLWQHILVKINERLTVDPSVVEEGAANLINADSLGGVLAKDYATKADLDAIDSLVADPTLTQEGLAAESKATGTRFTVIGDRVAAAENRIATVENNKVESINGLTGKNITLDVGTMGAVLKTGDTMSGALITPATYAKGDYPTHGYMKADGTPIVLMQVDANNNRLGIHQKRGGASVWDSNEAYMLPVPNLDQTATVVYDILTSKNPVTVAQGGTGATDAATARANLGITPQNIGAMLQYPDRIEFVTDTSANHGGYIDFKFNGATSDHTSRIIESASGVLDVNNISGGKVRLGTVITGIWNGSAIPVANGGTGATDASNARKNLLTTSLKTTDAATTALVQGVQVSILDAVALGTGDPTGGTLLTAANSNNRGMQIANGYNANSLKWRFLHTDQTSDAGVKGYSPWYTIYHSGNINTLMTEITNRLSNASGVSF